MIDYVYEKSNGEGSYCVWDLRDKNHPRLLCAASSEEDGKTIAAAMNMWSDG